MDALKKFGQAVELFMGALRNFLLYMLNFAKLKKKALLHRSTGSLFIEYV